MERGKREKREERNEEIVILDKGIDVEDMAGPKGVCCSGAFIALRW